ncbi:MAG: hypothetical protein RJA44_38 [Pseudomonadota bacterium]
MLQPKSFLKSALAVAACLTGLAAQADGHGPHWSYADPHHHSDPAHWAELDPAFESCAKGTHQSPVNIGAAQKAELPALEFSYGTAKPSIVNNGHTIQVNVPAGQKLKVGEQSYELLQFHFHAPSEEAFRGKRMPMVAHFVHRNTAGQLGVVAVLFDRGALNAAFNPVFEHIPAKAGETLTVEDLSLDLAALLPSDKHYYSFEGSLTTPPCSEGVNWMVLKNPVKLSAAQIQAFRKLYSSNARPVQPLNDRVIKESL